MQKNTATGKKEIKQKSHRQKPRKGMEKVIVLEKIPFYKNIFFYVFVFFMLWILVGAEPFSPVIEQKPLNEIIRLLKEEEVQNVTVQGDTIEVQLKNGTKLITEKEATVSFSEILTDHNIDISKISGEYIVEKPSIWVELLPTLLSFALPIAILIFFLSKMKGTGGDILSFGKSRAKLFQKGKTKITFADVAGNKEAKSEVTEVVDFLKFPDKYRKLGARIPKGVLLVGPAGVGKTLIAKAIAGEADVPFYSVSGSEFMEMLVGVGSARVRDLFAMARASQPSLIFIDEIDAIGRQRGMGIGGGHDEREQTLNQILTEMDGFDPRANVIVIAATNRPDMLDPALIRAGRFDRRVSIPLPDLEDREAIIRIHAAGKPLSEDVNLPMLAKKTVGFSGADIENMLNEASIIAARTGKTAVTEADLEEASIKVTLGPERKTLQSEEERKVTAYHEAGHAVVASFLPEMDPVNRISITARGGSLGHTSFPPEKDRYKETKTRLLSMIASMLAGRASEEIFFNEFTSGAADDIKRATKITRKMVTEYGMSSLGPVFYNGHDEESIWLAKQMGEYNAISQETASKVDGEVAKIIDGAYKRATEILEQNRNLLEKVAAQLLEKETLSQEEFRAILNEIQ